MIYIIFTMCLIAVIGIVGILFWNTYEYHKQNKFYRYESEMNFYLQYLEMKKEDENTSED